MDKLRSIEAFVRVVELGSFTRAAAALHLPKGTVTKLVQELESQLRVKLLHRTTRKLSLTDDGSAYLAGAQRVLADLADLEGSVTRAVTRPRGRLRVDVPAAAGRHVIAPALPDSPNVTPSPTSVRTSFIALRMRPISWFARLASDGGNDVCTISSWNRLSADTRSGG